MSLLSRRNSELSNSRCFGLCVAFTTLCNVDFLASVSTRESLITSYVTLPSIADAMLN